jgi:invasion protein IalB
MPPSAECRATIAIGRYEVVIGLPFVVCASSNSDNKQCCRMDALLERLQQAGGHVSEIGQALSDVLSDFGDYVENAELATWSIKIPFALALPAELRLEIGERLKQTLAEYSIDADLQLLEAHDERFAAV